LAASFDASWLRACAPPSGFTGRHRLRIADLFSGCGGLSIGAAEACRALNISPRFALASDLYQPALDVYCHNLKPSHAIADPIEAHVDGALGARLTPAERELRHRVGNVDLAVSGPPCQGHSDLNNHTRRTDSKNQLVLRVVRFAEIFDPEHVLVENVQGIRHDRLGALSRTKDWLHRLGYRVTDAVISADSVGVPQARRRYFLFASRGPIRPLDRLASCFRAGVTTTRWAIGDLHRRPASTDFDRASKPTPINRQRIDYLFDYDVYDLPDHQRPECHAGGGHTYKAVYGRLKWNEPAPTITTGFGCMGQGRFVHPAARRTLTPHEAARLQFFPDFFGFGPRRRGEYQHLIGNAVPPKLAYAVLVYQLA
jgi:DNA (cytosine-5)-methyltransferase 1